MHLAAKMQLVDALSRRDQQMMVQRRCARWACERTHLEPLMLPAYDEVRAEAPLDGYRLDVALLLNGVVVYGIEIFHSHRVDRAKAAGLSVPWIEVEAAAAAQTPGALLPVREKLLSGDDEAMLRLRLQTKRSGLSERLQHYLHSSNDWALFRTFDQVPSSCATNVFNTYQEVGSSLVNWHCDSCKPLWERFCEQRRVEEQARQEARLQGLKEQQPIFGLHMVNPFSESDLPDFQRDAASLRFAVQYLRHPPEILLEHFRSWGWDVLVACRCWNCQKAILCIEVHEYYRAGAIYEGLLEYFHPPQRFRGLYINKCRYCERRQKMQRVYARPHVVLSSSQMKTWLEAFL
ncbi:hypothetical protein [Deinococcus aquaedulcis]